MPNPAPRAPILPDATPQSDAALTALLAWLEQHAYRFTTITPASHARVVARPDKRKARTVRDVFGWSLPFEKDVLPPELFQTLRAAGLLEEGEQGWRSLVRVSSFDDLLFLHSAFPTEAEDSVFFGPDSYRFAQFIRDQLSPHDHPLRIIDIGAGAGVGGIVAGRLRATGEVHLTDVNPKALSLARLNAAHAGVAVRLVEAEGFDGLEGEFDAVLINPPYIIDPAGRAYRDGGDMHGAKIAFDLALQASNRLAVGGQLLLYTGAPVVEGRDELLDALQPRIDRERCALDYRELDPDVFGEELERPEYAEVERIALVGCILTRVK